MTKEEFMKSPRDFSFEVRPLDVNVAQMQFELIGKIKEVCPQPGCNFQPIEVSANPTLKHGKITISLQKSDENNYQLLLTVNGKEKDVGIEIVMYEADWGEVCRFIEKSNVTYGGNWGFFSICKAHALWVEYCEKSV